MKFIRSEAVAWIGSIHSSDEARVHQHRACQLPTVTWHRSFLSISSEFRGNAVEPRYIFERRMLEKLGSSHEVDVEMRRVSVIQITFHWHASLRLRSLLSFRLLSTRERKARAIFLFPSSSHPFCSCFSSLLISITFLS